MSEALKQVVGWRPTDTFGARLLLIRHEMGTTQVEAAERCGLDDGSWSNWENGRVPRNLPEVVHKIAQALGVERDWLMWGGDLPSPSTDWYAEGAPDLPVYPSPRLYMLGQGKLPGVFG